MFRPDDMPETDRVPRAAAIDAAITEAAYQILSTMYQKQQKLFNETRDDFLSTITYDNPNNDGILRGIQVGRLLASTILRSRRSNNSDLVVNYTPIMAPGYRQQDPTHPNQGFLIRASNIVGKNVHARAQYLDSQKYINDYNQIVSLGSRNSQVRTADQTEIAIFWGYDGAPKIGVPRRVYNQVVRVIAMQKKNKLEENARLFALINYAIADAGIAAWETKYYSGFWRPIYGIRQGTRKTAAISNWLPLGSPADGAGDNFTPGFPSYVSGHSTFGSATFEMLRLFYKTDQIQFQFQSDEYNGKTNDSFTGQVRPERVRQYQTLPQAEDENYHSRIYLGVHWPNDQEEGKIMGQSIAKYIFNTLT
ncbi:unnamed protein product [Rotaria sp. Silwood2]|nr:unnamed protein product [Rotaria sp. Silwood2]CAF3465321.1 unnamed protein product [Rotaria sp. Silwood2]CAF4461397.1 unnamed protein product [Rotaria sp. Silwood2]CAF4641654.1 unnamed protein product [Rotaria sp. Silwood2]